MTAQGNSLGNSPVEGGHSDAGTAEAAPGESPVDSPVDSPAPKPGPRPVPSPPTKRAESRADEAPASTWGRVEADGTVYVRTAEGERAVGQYPEGSPEEALSFFTRRFDALEFEVQLLEQRVRSGALSPTRRPSRSRRSRRSSSSPTPSETSSASARGWTPWVR